jgi:acetyl esterase/lipase
MGWDNPTPTLRVAHFKGTVEQAVPSQTIKIANTGYLGNCNWRVSSTSHRWITTSAANTSVAPGQENGQWTVNVDSSTLSAGTTWGVVQLTTSSGKTFAVGVEVELAGSGGSAPSRQDRCSIPAATINCSLRTDIALDDLWEDTVATRDLSYQFRIYKHKELPSRLHEQLRLYFVYPERARPEDRRPAVVFIHGGGWGQGNPDQWFPQCRYFALRGLVGVSVNYRLKSNTTTIIGCLTDCKSAIRYLRRHAARLGIDPEKILVVGESAGGHLAAALGTIDGYDEPGEDLTVSAAPNALVLLNPITDLATRWGESLGEKAQSLSPLSHISKNTPPTLLIHGDADRVVDIHHARSFHEKMLAMGNRSRLPAALGSDVAAVDGGRGARATHLCPSLTPRRRPWGCRASRAQARGLGLTHRARHQRIDDGRAAAPARLDRGLLRGRQTQPWGGCSSGDKP